MRTLNQTGSSQALKAVTVWVIRPTLCEASAYGGRMSAPVITVAAEWELLVRVAVMVWDERALSELADAAVAADDPSSETRTAALTTVRAPTYFFVMSFLPL
jgi:HAMP domain-containing protein